MTLPPSGENSDGFTFDNELDSFIDEVNTDDAARQEAELSESEKIIWLTERLKKSAVQDICLSFPDGTRNEAAVSSFEAGMSEEISTHISGEDMIEFEQYLYARIVELLDISDGLNEDSFSMISRMKQALIAYWMLKWQLPFESKWVTTLNDIIPGEKKSEPDLEKAKAILDQHSQKKMEIVEKIVVIFENDSPLDVSTDGSVVREKAGFYFDSALNLINELITGAIVSKGELDYQLKQLELDYAISSVAQRECLELCAELFHFDLSEYL